VLPGVQALFGFQLVVVFNQRFAEELGAGEQHVHLVALGFTALATALLMRLRRTIDRSSQAGSHARSCAWLALPEPAMVPLLLGVSMDFYLIARVILRSATLATLDRARRREQLQSDCGTRSPSLLRSARRRAP